jgi:hypothetical protein
MPDLEHERIILESLLEPGDVVPVFVRVPKGPWELNQDCAQAAGFEQWRILILEQAFVSRARVPVVRKSLLELAGELESLILFNLLHPAFRRARRDRTIEGDIDLDRIKELGDIGQLLKALRL